VRRGFQWGRRGRRRVCRRQKFCKVFSIVFLSRKRAGALTFFFAEVRAAQSEEVVAQELTKYYVKNTKETKHCFKTKTKTAEA
jgi:hypothetical protein